MAESFTWDSGLAWDTPGINWDGAAASTHPNRPMASDNRISITLTAEQRTALTQAADAFEAALDGLTINLTPEERRTLPKIADKTMAFDDKCETYMGDHPDLVPGFIEMDELAKDRALIADLLPVLRKVAPLLEALEDTISLASTDCFGADLAFYQNVKQAAKRGIPAAGAIYDDLKARFPGRPRGENPAPPAP